MRYLSLALALLLCPVPVLAADPASPPAPAGTTATPAQTPAAAMPAATPGAPATAAGTDALPADAAPTWIYLVARAKLADSDLTQVTFLRHPAMDTPEACEAERGAILMFNSRHFQHYDFKTAGKTGYRLDFRCVPGEQYLAPWRKGEHMDLYYRVKTTDGKLEVESHDTFFDCRHALRRSTREESIDHFCARASQALTAPPVLPPDSPDPEAEAEAGATPPLPATGTPGLPAGAGPVPAGVKPGAAPAPTGAPAKHAGPASVLPAR